MALTDNERYIRQFRNDLNEGIFNNPITGGRTDIGETAGGTLDYLVGGGMDLYGMGADLFNGSDREYDSDDALSLLNTGTSVFMPKFVGGALNTIGKLGQKPTNALLRGLTSAYNKAAGTNRGAMQFGKPKLTAQAAKLKEAQAAAGKNAIVPSSGRLPAKTLNNPAGTGAKGSATAKVDPKKGGGVIGAIKRNPVKTALAGTAGALGVNAALNTAFDDEEVATKPVPGERPLDEVDKIPGPDGQGPGQGGPNQPLSERDKAAMLLDKAQQLKPRGPIRSAQDVAEDALARDVFEAGASKTRDILNEDELERKRAMRLRQQGNSEQNMLRDAWRNSATGRKSRKEWDELSDEDRGMYEDRYRQSKGYFPNSGRRLAAQREEDYKQGGADGTISNMDQLEEEIRRRNMQRQLEAAGGFGVGRIGGGMSLDEFETETGRKEALPPDPAPAPAPETPNDVFDTEEEAGPGYERFLPYAMMLASRGKFKNFPMPKGLANKGQNFPALTNRGQKLLESRRGYPNGGLPQKSATGEQFRRAQTGMGPSERAIGSNANISNAPYKNLSLGSGPNARVQGRFRSRQDLEDEIRKLNQGLF